MLDWRKRSIVIGVAVSMAAVAPVIAARASATPAREATDPRAVADPMGNQVTEVASWGRATMPDAFAGVWVQDGKIHLGSTNGAVDMQRLAGPLSSPVPVIATRVSRSWNDLTRIQARVDADTPWLRAHGIDITMSGIKPQDNRVIVGVRRLSASAKQLLADRYGRAGIEITERGYSHPLDRTVTTPPWQGGIVLLGVCQSTSTDCLAANCTANFSMFDFIQNVEFGYKLTAGHCFTPNTHVTNGTGVALGPVLQSFYSSGSNADVEDILIPTTTLTDRIITNDPSTQPVVTYDNQQVTGISVCKSGISTGETCSFTVSVIHAQINICEDPPACDIIVTLLDQVVSDSPTPALADGDSGAPVYRYVNGGVEAEGILSAGNDPNTEMDYSFILDEINTLNKFLCLAPTC